MTTEEKIKKLFEQEYIRGMVQGLISASEIVKNEALKLILLNEAKRFLNDIKKQYENNDNL